MYCTVQLQYSYPAWGRVVARVIAAALNDGAALRVQSDPTLNCGHWRRGRAPLRVLRARRRSRGAPSAWHRSLCAARAHWRLDLQLLACGGRSLVSLLHSDWNARTSLRLRPLPDGDPLPISRLTMNQSVDNQMPTDGISI